MSNCVTSNGYRESEYGDVFRICFNVRRWKRISVPDMGKSSRAWKGSRASRWGGGGRPGRNFSIGGGWREVAAGSGTPVMVIPSVTGPLPRLIVQLNFVFVTNISCTTLHSAELCSFERKSLTNARTYTQPCLLDQLSIYEQTASEMHVAPPGVFLTAGK